MKTIPAFSDLSDADLLAETVRLSQAERAATVSLIGALAELDYRRLYLGESCSSLYKYCTRTLRLSEHAAYARIAAARTSRRFPLALELFARGDITLTAITLLSPYLTPENHESLLREAIGKSRRDVALIVARLNPQPAVSASVVPLAPGVFKLQCALSQDAHDNLVVAQDLLRHVIPTGDIGLVVERALATLVRDLTKLRSATTDRPRPASVSTTHSRHVSAAIRRVVWRRDRGRCAFVGPRGQCGERGGLEYHHVVPYADGGETSVNNLQLRCRAHNVYEADLYFGESGFSTTRSGPSEETEAIGTRERSG
jgi:5-methylcytosine-specific restriction endonuclease McrA